MNPVDETARVLLAAHDRGLQPAPDEAPDVADVATAAAIVERIAQWRVARGERRLGYKIGFTNRTIWARYGVDHPIWAPIYDTTVGDLSAAGHSVSLAGMLEPRLEPEIVLGFAQPPESPDPAAIARSVAWVAHGFEIVQSVYPGWRFTGAQSFAAQGLHGRLLVGTRVPVPALCEDPDRLPALLSGLRLSLFEGDADTPCDQGIGTNVLDGPCEAVGYLMRELSRRGVGLMAGDIVTTGTITDAQPLRAGQHWRTTIEGVPGLAGLGLGIRP